MGLSGKLVAAMEFKAGGDMFHEMFRHKPEQVSIEQLAALRMCKDVSCRRVNLGNLDPSPAGGIPMMKTEDCQSTDYIQAIDEAKKLIEFRILEAEGDLMETYKDFVVSMHMIDIKGDDIDMVTWSLEYEMLKEDQVEHPISFLSFFIDLTKDIENHHIGKT